MEYYFALKKNKIMSFSATWMNLEIIVLSEVSQSEKDKKRDKRVRDGDPSWGGSHEGGEVSKHQETLSLAGLWGVLESQRTT